MQNYNNISNFLKKLSHSQAEEEKFGLSKNIDTIKKGVGYV